MKPKSVERIKAEKYVVKHPNATASELQLKCGVALATAYKVLEEASRSSKITGMSGKQYELMDFTPMPFTVEEVLQEAKKDMVNHPTHYKTGGIETIDFIEAKGLCYHLGNVVKYIARADHKGNKLEDLKKAQWYLNRAIERINNES